MSQANHPKSESPAPSQNTTPPGFDGASLRREREQRGVTLKQISEVTRISVGVLEAMEAERFADVPPARVYVRGFVRNIAEELGLDPDEVSSGYVPRWDKWQQKQLFDAMSAEEE